MSQIQQPEVIISEIEADRLYALLDKLSGDSFPGKAALEAELGRADIRPAQDVPADVVAMNSKVTFRVSGSEEAFCKELVYPHESDGTPAKVSILAPVGSALLGLAQGSEMHWPKPGGGTLTVIIEAVEHAAV